MKDEHKKVLFIKIRANKIEEESSEHKVYFAFVNFVQINNELFVHCNFRVVILLFENTLIKLL